MTSITDCLICLKKNHKEEFNELCETNNIYGIYRTEFENILDKVDKKC